MVKKEQIMMHMATQLLVAMVAAQLRVTALLLIMQKRYFASSLVRVSLEDLILMVSSNHQEGRTPFTR